MHAIESRIPSAGLLMSVQVTALRSDVVLHDKVLCWGSENRWHTETCAIPRLLSLKRYISSARQFKEPLPWGSFTLDTQLYLHRGSWIFQSPTAGIAPPVSLWAFTMFHFVLLLSFELEEVSRCPIFCTNNLVSALEALSILLKTAYWVLLNGDMKFACTRAVHLWTPSRKPHYFKCWHQKMVYMCLVWLWEQQSSCQHFSPIWVFGCLLRTKLQLQVFLRQERSLPTLPIKSIKT